MERDSSTSNTDSRLTLTNKTPPDSRRSSFTTDYWTISKAIYYSRTPHQIFTESLRATQFEQASVVVSANACYAGNADPRTQQSSSFYDNRFKDVIQKEAPKMKGFGKWSVSQYGYNPNAAWK
ncbi:hypothetical protein BCR33DRAFT_799937 [Rhizoclosmatium globosum]|uniref:Uncharacterized protein n=1 Tax=Rhizoclosmatium globosum TaxID=329046 RepID=A0A1Y1ZZE9_9FUNG|nr:hypothetical protein BCR33DRAFT_799937 [Rhizoclosmatium globosum]|eukprot:ORY15641.1 hypothetical protein BCR33DRAFT_799937 [Rhizoclosmatium globosum]